MARDVTDRIFKSDIELTEHLRRVASQRELASDAALGHDGETCGASPLAIPFEKPPTFEMDN